MGCKGQRVATEHKINPGVHLAPGAGDNGAATPTAREAPRGRALVIAAAVCLALALAVAGLGMEAAPRYPWIDNFAKSLSPGLVRAAGVVTYDTMNEQPHLAAVSLTAAGPICDETPDRFVPALTSAFGLMRGTRDGARLYELLVARDVCIAIDDIPYNGGYATSWRTASGEWFRGTITLDDNYVRSRTADVVAAMLVHEATHIDRAIKGESCDNRNDCAELPNGVELEEEVAAHAAEARWWIAAYGDNGKRFSVSADYGENRLAEAYLAGPGIFRAYVRELRSDPREGEGL
jgi:hypothetical protein